MSICISIFQIKGSASLYYVVKVGWTQLLVNDWKWLNCLKSIWNRFYTFQTLWNQFVTFCKDCKRMFLNLLKVSRITWISVNQSDLTVFGFTQKFQTERAWRWREKEWEWKRDWNFKVFLIRKKQKQFINFTKSKYVISKAKGKILTTLLNGMLKHRFKNL